VTGKTQRYLCSRQTTIDTQTKVTIQAPINLALRILEVGLQAPIILWSMAARGAISHLESIQCSKFPIPQHSLVIIIIPLLMTIMQRMRSHKFTKFILDKDLYLSRTYSKEQRFYKVQNFKQAERLI